MQVGNSKVSNVLVMLIFVNVWSGVLILTDGLCKQQEAEFRSWQALVCESLPSGLTGRQG